MSDSSRQLAERLQERFGDSLQAVIDCVGEVTIEVDSTGLIEVATALRDEPRFGFEELIDLCGIDYASFGQDEWFTVESSGSGFSRGVEAATAGVAPSDRIGLGIVGVGMQGSGLLRRALSLPGVECVGRLQAVTEELSVERPCAARRFAVVYHLLSISNNRRLRIRVFAPDDELPVVPSVIAVWNSANWYEREAFDLFGILFDGHPDLRRLLTDYGFIGHPFRKDFPLSGNVEVIYDAEKQRVVYQPVSIEPRVLVPKVVRAGAAEAVDLMQVVEEAAAEAAAGEASD